jgi:hypothetical protein
MAPASGRKGAVILCEVSGRSITIDHAGGSVLAVVVDSTEVEDMGVFDVREALTYAYAASTSSLECVRDERSATCHR